ncbi:hypothetical protein AAY473_037314 [Plecturocebus cupreus]
MNYEGGPTKVNTSNFENVVQPAVSHGVSEITPPHLIVEVWFRTTGEEKAESEDEEEEGVKLFSTPEGGSKFPQKK